MLRKLSQICIQRLIVVFYDDKGRIIAASATANMAVMAKVTSTAKVAVTGDGKGDFQYNSGSDRRWQR